MMEQKILIYQEDEGIFQLEVKLNKETIWLSQKQMAELFEKDTDTIGLHLKNIYKSGELTKIATTEKYSVVQKEGTREVKRMINLYNLDAIISVGYRVNSKKGTQFRIWATNTLKQHLIKGYTENKARLSELEHSIQLIKTAVDYDKINSKESKDIIDVLTDFALGLDILDGYDHQNLKISETNDKTHYIIEYQEAKKAINQLKSKYGGSELFGNEKDDSFKSSISTINQTFDGKELYKSLDEKAANLLYFIVKNHSFTD